MTLDDIQRLLSPFARRIANFAARAIIKSVDDSKKMQLVQLSLLDVETRDAVEHFQNYGFTSRPAVGAEAILLSLGGHRDHGVAIVVEDRRYRVLNLDEGEVAVYDKTGSKIVFKKNGDIEVTPSSGKMKVTGSIEASGDVKAGSISLMNHTHAAGALLTGPSVGTPVTGTTAAPS